MVWEYVALGIIALYLIGEVGAHALCWWLRRHRWWW